MVLPSFVPKPTLIAVAEGTRIRRFERVRDGDRLVLERGIGSELVLKAAVPVLDRGLQLELFASYSGDEPLGRQAGGALARFDASGRGELLLPHPGPYDLLVKVVRSADQQRFHVECSPAALEASETSGGRHEIELDPDSLHAALERARRD